MNPPSTADKRRTFRQLHEAGCFVIPNPWDVGSARYLQSLGFKALASTSAGLAWSLGEPDNGLAREQVLTHLHELVAATELPLNADFENGFGSNAAELAESVGLAVQAGVAGLSIEDSTGDAAHPLFAIDEAVERLRAAPSTAPVATRCWWAAPSVSWSAGPTSTRPSPACRPTPTPAPTACTRRACAAASRSPPSWRPWRPSR